MAEAIRPQPNTIIFALYTTLVVDGITYKAICVENRCYVPDRNVTA